ncbi:hypothetical protein D7B12_17880 [Salmonella enterica]|nr:hypothetical protein [Salmonella enterica]
MARALYQKQINYYQITLQNEAGAAVLSPSDQVLYAVMAPRGKVYIELTSLDSKEPGSDWARGIIGISIDTKSNHALFADAKDLLLVIRTKYGQHIEKLRMMEQLELERSQLFFKDIVVPEMRRDQLLVASCGAMRDVKLSDEYIWNKIKAAESEIAHKLRILLIPHQVFPKQPTPEEIDALDGMPWMVETPYDYQPNLYDRDKWGYFITRQRPIIDVQRLRYQMPSQGNQYFDIPLDWLRLDKKYGHVRVLPTTNASLVTASVLGFTALTWQSIIPNMMNVTYTAGIEDAEGNYPELIDAIKKMAVVKILTDLFLPQSGSISADGLSESMSTDISKYQEQIDHIINGQDGNGGLMAIFNGIRAIFI